MSNKQHTHTPAHGKTRKVSHFTYKNSVCQIYVKYFCKLSSWENAGKLTGKAIVLKLSFDIFKTTLILICILIQLFTDLKNLINYFK